MEKSKRKNGELNRKHYWQIFGTLAVVLLIMVRFPIRIMLYETFYDMLVYGSISLGCLLTAIYVYRQGKWQFRRLIAVILLCAFLSGWQVFDLAVLRMTHVPILDFGYRDDPDYIGFAWYAPRFPNGYFRCHSIYERYFGNEYMAITTSIYHMDPYYACGI